MSEPLYSIGLTAPTLSVSGNIAVGNALVYDSTQQAYVVATSTARTSADSRTQGIALQSFGGLGKGVVAYQASGTVATSVSGLAATTAHTYQLVRVSTTGMLERIASYTAGDDVVGYAFPDGRVALHIGLPWDQIVAMTGGALSAAGVTGDIQVKAVGGGLAVAGYWKGIDNLGTLRAAYWDDADGVTLRANVRVSWGTFNGAETFPSYGFFRLSSGFYTTGGWSFLSINDGLNDRGLMGMSGGTFFAGDSSGTVPTIVNGKSIQITSGTLGVSINGSSGGVSVSGGLSVSGNLSGGSGGLAISSTSIVTAGGSTTLSSAQAACPLLVVTGTGGTIVAPGAPYLVDAVGASGAVTVKYATGTGAVVPAGKAAWVFGDGTNYQIVNPSTGLSTTGANGQFELADGAGGLTAPANMFAGAGWISVGLASAPTTNGIRLANLYRLTIRNAAGTGDNDLVRSDGADNVFISNTNAPGTHIDCQSGGSINLRPSASTKFYVSGTQTQSTNPMSVGTITAPTTNGILLASTWAISSLNTAAVQVKQVYLDASNNAFFGSNGSGVGDTYLICPSAQALQLTVGGAIVAAVYANGMQLGGGGQDFGGGAGAILGIDNCTTVPSTNPTAGGIIYATGGALKYRGPSGTITPVGSADPHCTRCGTDVGVTECENDFFGEHLTHCHSCELKTGKGVVQHIADFWDWKKVA